MAGGTWGVNPQPPHSLGETPLSRFIGTEPRAPPVAPAHPAASPFLLPFSCFLGSPQDELLRSLPEALQQGEAKLSKILPHQPAPL